MRFEITNGVPTPDELAAIEAAMAAQHRPHKAGQGALMPGA